ncbi:MAG: hypothetical protein OXG35_01085 [Acidobacteria bacterium]|nr:hypothetical protein [Acidobacteriota bacterium]
MHVDGDTIQAMIPDPATGDESMAAVALLIMDDTLDLMKTTGWYWCRVDVHGPPKDHQTWVQAVREARGPVRSPDLAFQAAQGANIPAMDAAIRLSDAAEAVRTGLIAPDLESITMYVSTSLEQDQSRRDESGDPNRTAVGLHIEDNLRAAEAQRQEIEASGVDPYRDPAEEALEAMRESLADNPGAGQADELIDDETADREIREALEHADPEHKQMLEQLEREALAEEAALRGDTPPTAT